MATTSAGVSALFKGGRLKLNKEYNMPGQRGGKKKKKKMGKGKGSRRG